jgi:hypothetical protein
MSGRFIAMVGPSGVGNLVEGRPGSLGIYKCMVDLAV